MLKLGQDTKDKLLEGVNRAGNAVKVTAGAEGKFAIIENNLGLPPHVTKDGVTVLDHIYGNDQYEELGVQLLKQSANKTKEITQDGTTTTTILSQALINNLFSIKDASHVNLIKGVKKALADTFKLLNKVSKTVGDKEMVDVATVSANGDREIGSQIASIYQRVGLDSTIEVREGYTTKTEVNYNEGVRLDRGWSLPHFSTDFVKYTTEFEDCLLVLYNDKIKTLNDIKDVLLQARDEKRPIVIIADDVEEPVMASLVKMNRDGNLQVCVCTSPEYGELRERILEDISFITGASIYNDRFKENIVCGNLKKFIAFKDKTLLLPDDNFLVKIRVEELSKQLEVAEKSAEDRLKNRIANLKSSIVEITVGGVTDLEIKEKKDRIDDAVPALRNAIEGGYIAGGGSTLHYISNKLVNKLKGDEALGYDAFLKAIREPMRVILENGGIKDVELPNKYGRGVDVKSGKVINMLKAGIIDPTKVTKTALENATSVASIALSTDVLILSKNTL